MRCTCLLACALAATVLSAPVTADELTLTPTPQPSVERPARGMSMEKVEANYGAPEKRVPAVGEPPITRWEYPGFVVYFEHQFVIHAVATS